MMLHRFFLSGWCLLAMAAFGQEQQKDTQNDIQPTWSIKNNLLYDATLTLNIGLEFRIGPRSTLQAFYGLNPWKWSDTKKWRHWSLMPEYRYWLNKEKAPYLLGWFAGVHALGGEFNVGGVKMPFGMMKWLENNRYEGWYIGGGLTLGHAWRLSERWRLEAAIGVGYIRLKYDQYENEVCGDFVGKDTYHYFGPTKLALNIAYTFGKKSCNRSCMRPCKRPCMRSCKISEARHCIKKPIKCQNSK